MPVITESEPPQRRPRGTGALWLGWQLPLLLAALLLTTQHQPLHLGPFVVASTSGYAPGLGRRTRHVRFVAPPTGFIPLRATGQRDAVTGEVHALIVPWGDYGAALLWFRGQRR